MTQEFYNQTKKVRDLQKKYFSTRNQGVLQESKKAERELDQMIDALEEVSLFSITSENFIGMVHGVARNNSLEEFIDYFRAELKSYSPSEHLDTSKMIMNIDEINFGYSESGITIADFKVTKSEVVIDILGASNFGGDEISFNHEQLGEFIKWLVAAKEVIQNNESKEHS